MAKLSRLVLNFPGFEATNAAHQIERLTAGSQKTATVWNFQTDRKSLDEQAGEHKAVAEFSNSGKGWKTHTRYVQFEWSDIVDHYEAVPYPFNLVRHLPDYLRFFLDGTVWKYFAASGRYFGFTVYPIIYMIACFILPLLICMAFGMHWLASLIIALIALV